MLADTDWSTVAVEDKKGTLHSLTSCHLFYCATRMIKMAREEFLGCLRLAHRTIASSRFSPRAKSWFTLCSLLKLSSAHFRIIENNQSSIIYMGKYKIKIAISFKSKRDHIPI